MIYLYCPLYSDLDWVRWVLASLNVYSSIWIISKFKWFTNFALVYLTIFIALIKKPRLSLKWWLSSLHDIIQCTVYNTWWDNNALLVMLWYSVKEMICTLVNRFTGEIILWKKYLPFIDITLIYPMLINRSSSKWLAFTLLICVYVCVCRYHVYYLCALHIAGLYSYE